MRLKLLPLWLYSELHDLLFDSTHRKPIEIEAKSLVEGKSGRSTGRQNRQEFIVD